MKIYFCAGGVGGHVVKYLAFKEAPQLHSYFAISGMDTRFEANKDFNYLVKEMKKKDKGK